MNLIKSTVVSSLLFVSLASHASEVFDYLDLAYSKQNTDYFGFGNSDAATLKASMSAFDWVHVRGRYNSGDVRLPVNNAQQDSWSVLGLGAHYFVSDDTAIFLGTEHNKLALKSGSTESGLYHHIGLKHQFSQDWQVALEVGEVDVLIRDTTFVVETVYKVAEQIGFSATLRDYDDLDLTEYEIGVRWFFRD